MKLLQHHRKLLGQVILKKFTSGSNRKFLTGIGSNYKYFSSQTNGRGPGISWSCHLKNRSVISLSGKDTYEFLQGLVTNDVHQMTESAAQYTFMLNVQGRVLYDLFLYQHSNSGSEDVEVLMDADTSVTGQLLKILKFYKLRKKVAISDATEKYQVWAEGLSKENENSTSCAVDTPETVIGGLDPRVPSFGKRVIRHAQTAENNAHEIDESEYRKLRYTWGIPEGVVDLPPGNCFPLESNAAFMNGVDFQKGCYIGQELTARTFHTGVTRKRVMPILFESDSPSIDHDATIKTEKGKNAGKFRSSEGNCGLALVRLANIKDKMYVTAGDETIPLTTFVPDWWPEIET